MLEVSCSAACPWRVVGGALRSAWVGIARGLPSSKVRAGGRAPAVFLLCCTWRAAQPTGACRRCKQRATRIVCLQRRTCEGCAEQRWLAAAAATSLACYPQTAA